MKTLMKTGCILYFLLLCKLCLAQTQPAATVARVSNFNVDFSGRPLPIFRGGVVLARQQTPPGLSVFDAAGKLLHQQNIVIPGAASITVIDAASTQDGEVIAILVSTSNAGTSDILFTGVNARATKTVRLDGFAPRRIVFGADNVLWAFGRSHNTNLQEAESYDTVRKYDQSGNLIGTALPRAAFKPSKISPSSESFLAAGNGRIGILSLITSEWVELSNQGVVLGRWPVRIPEAADITGVAMTNSNEMFVTQQADAITLRKLNKTTGEFLQVDTRAVTNAANQGMLLLGNQGDELIVRVKPPSSLFWLQVP